MNTHLIKAASVAGLALGVLSYSPVLTAGQATERTLYVSVMDPTGAPAADLKQDEFVVKEDGTTRPVTRVVRATGPIHFAVLTYTTPTAVEQVREAVKSFYQALLGVEPKTEFLFMEFAGAALTLTDFTSDLTKIDAAANKLVPKQSQPALNEALIDVSRKMAALPPNSRRVILTIGTEPALETTNIQPKTVFDEVRKSGASVWSVALQEGAGRDSNREQLLKGLAANTGGRWVLLQGPVFAPLKGLLRSIAANTFSQYAVTFVGGDSKKPPKVTDVTVSRQGFFALALKWSAQ